MKQSKSILLISSVAACGGLLFGFDTAVISGVLPFLRTTFSLGEWMSGWIVSILTIGCIAGVLIAGKVADRYGRKTVLYAGALLFLLSAVCTALAGNITIFQVFRFLGGVAVGMVSVASPMYIAEISPPEKRGRLVAINQLAIVTGILAAFFSNYFLSSLGANSWRWMLSVMGFPAICFFALLFFVPESPRWLARITSEKQTSLTELWKSASRKMLFIGVILAILQQITGINTIMYYAPTIFDSMGFGMDSALLQTVLIGSVNFIFTIVSMFHIDAWGRKPLLLCGSALMTISIGVLSAVVNTEINQYVVLVCILVYIASFAVSLGPVTWVLIAEIFPDKYREMGMSISTMFLWMAVFGITFIFPVMLSALGISGTYFVFTIICSIAFLFYLFAVKETKNTSLDDVQ
jgi:MFS family permease